ENYIAYYELCLQLVRPGGLIAIDNTLWDGKVAEPDNREPETEAIRSLNSHLHDDDRIELCLITVADGLTLARKL
ncbi:MAG: SAM-dependent methyltransferase, partial [Bacteroidetes bacterium]